MVSFKKHMKVWDNIVDLICRETRTANKDSVVYRNTLFPGLLICILYGFMVTAFTLYIILKFGTDGSWIWLLLLDCWIWVVIRESLSYKLIINKCGIAELISKPVLLHNRLTCLKWKEIDTVKVRKWVRPGLIIVDTNGKKHRINFEWVVFYQEELHKDIEHFMNI